MDKNRSTDKYLLGFIIWLIVLVRAFCLRRGKREELQARFGLRSHAMLRRSRTSATFAERLGFLGFLAIFLSNIQSLIHA